MTWRNQFLVMVAAVLLYGTAHAALRGTAQAANSATASSITVSLTGISGLADGDILVCAVEVGGGNAATFTFPAGFAIPSGLGNLAINNGAGNDTLGIEYWVVSGTVPSSVAISASQTDYMAAQCRAYSGRKTTSTFDAVASTSSTALSGASPMTFAMTGLTAVSGDDIVIMGGFSNVYSRSGDSYTFAGPSGYANGLTAFGNVSYAIVMGSADRTNSSAGATGTINSTLTYTVSLGAPPDAAGYALALAPSSGGSCTHSGITSGGALAVPNGTSGSYWGKTGSFVTPDCSTVNYWQPAVGNFGVN